MATITKSLTTTLKNCPYDLGPNFEHLGTADLWGGKTYLVYHHTTLFKLCRLNCIQRICRAFFGCYKDTHLNRVLSFVKYAESFDSKDKQKTLLYNYLIQKWFTNHPREVPCDWRICCPLEYASKPGFAPFPRW